MMMSRIWVFPRNAASELEGALFEAAWSRHSMLQNGLLFPSQFVTDFGFACHTLRRASLGASYECENFNVAFASSEFGPVDWQVLNRERNFGSYI